MSVIHDQEFGEVLVRRSTKASSIRIRVTPDGRLRASLPLYAPLFLLKRLLRTSRPQLRSLLEEHHGSHRFEHGMQIGKSHTIVVQEVNEQGGLTVARSGQQIIVRLPLDVSIHANEVQAGIRKEVLQAYRREAKSYLPRRLKVLADTHGFSYSTVRFSHAGGRWGSCNNSGVISLNIALMKLPFPLIDYVLIHELSHTQELNHSKAFWELVATSHPSYKQDRSLLKSESPNI